MNLILVLGVCVAFLSAILTGGYEDKPGTKQKTKKATSQHNTKIGLA